MIRQLIIILILCFCHLGTCIAQKVEVNNGPLLIPNEKLGIGTSTPLYPIHIKGNGYFEDQIGIGELPGESGQPLGVKGDLAVGGGEDGFDSASEVVLFRGQSETWYLGATNTTVRDDSDFYVGLEGNGEGFLNVKHNGRIGMGTTSPAGFLDIARNTPESSAPFLHMQNSNVGNVFIRWSSGNILSSYRQYSVGIDQSDNRTLKFSTSTSALGDLEDNTIMTLHPEKKVSINTDEVPSGYQFAVKGKIINEGVNIRLQQDWPDYVFSEDYKMMDLSSLEKYIADNGHLPNVPSAIEIAMNGLSVEDSSVFMMEKIEELTLYIIELEKKINKLQDQVGKTKLP